MFYNYKRTNVKARLMCLLSCLRSSLALYILTNYYNFIKIFHTTSKVGHCFHKTEDCYDDLLPCWTFYVFSARTIEHWWLCQRWRFMVAFFEYCQFSDCFEISDLTHWPKRSKTKTSLIWDHSASTNSWELGYSSSEGAAFYCTLKVQLLKHFFFR